MADVDTEKSDLELARKIVSKYVPKGRYTKLRDSFWVPPELLDLIKDWLSPERAKAAAEIQRLEDLVCKQAQEIEGLKEVLRELRDGGVTIKEYYGD